MHDAVFANIWSHILFFAYKSYMTKDISYFKMSKLDMLSGTAGSEKNCRFSDSLNCRFPGGFSRSDAISRFFDNFLRFWHGFGFGFFEPKSIRDSKCYDSILMSLFLF